MSTIKFDTLRGLSAAVVSMAGDLLKNLGISAYYEGVATPSISSGTLTLDMSTGNVFNVAHDANITTLTFSNWPASGKSGSCTLYLTQDATGGRTLTLPAACVTDGGSGITISTTANARNKLVFDTIDGGTTVDCALVGKDYA